MISKEEKSKLGKRSRAAGKAFELLVRKDLEKNWIVSKWQNNVEVQEEKINIPCPDNKPGCCVMHYTIVQRMKLAPCKPKFNPFTKSLMMNSGGFPDYLCFRVINSTSPLHPYKIYEVIGCECKTNGNLDKIEKEKCYWLLKNKIFSKIFIAKKGIKRGEVEYVDWILS